MIDCSVRRLVCLYVQLCQSKPECGRQTLTELLIRPVQRLPSIVLLLKGVYAAKQCISCIRVFALGCSYVCVMLSDCDITWYVRWFCQEFTEHFETYYYLILVVS